MNWKENPDLKHFSRIDCTSQECTCESPSPIELENHDSCVRGRIDTTFCLTCNNVITFKIIR